MTYSNLLTMPAADLTALRASSRAALVAMLGADAADLALAQEDLAGAFSANMEELSYLRARRPAGAVRLNRAARMAVWRYIAADNALAALPFIRF